MPHSLDPDCATGHVVQELELYGYRPNYGERDRRPLPDLQALDALVANVFDTAVSALADTRLEPDLQDLLWSITDLFHRKSLRLARELDTNEQHQRHAQNQQDGSEIRSVALENLIDQGTSLIETRDVFEYLRDRAAQHYKVTLGSAWRPRAGSMVNHKTLTASVIDSRDFIAAKQRAEREPLLPAGTRIAFAGGTDCNDHTAIWSALDTARAQAPDMVLVHGATPKGAEKIAAAWADNRGVTQITFKPEWTRDGKAAPFRRNDRLLETLPVALIVFPGSGITDNLADKAKTLGIRIADHRKRR